MKKIVDGKLIEMTEAEVAEVNAMQEQYRERNILRKIAECKQSLAEGDYKIIKFFEAMIPQVASEEGEPSEYNYATIIAERQALRERINALEREVDNTYKAQWEKAHPEAEREVGDAGRE